MDRRRFIGRMSAAIGAGFFLHSCTSGGKQEESTVQGSMEQDAFARELEKNRALPIELLHQLLDQKVDRYMQLSHHCAQSSFMALKEQFGLDGGEVVKALTPLAGIAERGETCGAVTGPLMALGLVFGRGELRLDDWNAYRASLVPASTFCRRFEAIYGSTMCHDIQKGEFGRCYHLTDPEELRAFQEAGATEHCSGVVKKAVRIAAEIILDEA